MMPNTVNPPVPSSGRPLICNTGAGTNTPPLKGA